MLTCGALLTLVVEVTDTFRAPGRALWALVLGGVFSLIATVGFGWVRTRGRPFAVGYVAVQLPLGMAMFATSHTTVGAAERSWPSCWCASGERVASWPRRAPSAATLR